MSREDQRDALTHGADRIERELLENILPFWARHAVDRERGTFHGALTNDLVVDRTAARGALLTSRILWTFSAAHRAHPNPEWLAMADFAYADLFTRFHDQKYGGFYWSVDCHGSPRETRKQVYGQAFAIYAMTEYHRASGRAEPLEQAIALFRFLEAYAADREFGGYLEAFSREWQRIDDVRLSAVDLNEPKSQNTHLHVMEAYTNLLRVWPRPELRRAQTELLGVMLDRILNPTTHSLGLFFSKDWQPRSQGTSPGHDIEASWLLMEAASVLGDEAISRRIESVSRKIADVTLATGVDADGAIYNASGPGGITDSNKEWWPQAEAVVGFLDAFEHFGDERFLRAALRCWEFIDARLVDRKSGEWLRGVTRDGSVLRDELKVSFWKCPYHNGRMCIEATARLRRIADRMGA